MSASEIMFNNKLLAFNNTVFNLYNYEAIFCFVFKDDKMSTSKK